MCSAGHTYTLCLASYDVSNTMFCAEHYVLSNTPSVQNIMSYAENVVCLALHMSYTYITPCPVLNTSPCAERFVSWIYVWHNILHVWSKNITSFLVSLRHFRFHLGKLSINLSGESTFCFQHCHKQGHPAFISSTLLYICMFRLLP
jgi:hypothetical protein